MYILRINNNLGDPPNRLVFICRAYNTWRLTTRDTRRLRERVSSSPRVAETDEDESLSLFAFAEANPCRQIKEFSRLKMRYLRNEKNRFDGRPASDKRGHVSRFDCCILS